METKSPTPNRSASKEQSGSGSVYTIQNLTSQKQVIPFTKDKSQESLTLNAYESAEMEGTRVPSMFKRYTEAGILSVTKV